MCICEQEGEGQEERERSRLPTEHGAGCWVLQCGAVFHNQNQESDP